MYTVFDCVPDFTVVDVERETDDSQQNSESSKDRHRNEELLGKVAKLLDNHSLVGRRSWAWKTQIV